MAPNLINRRAVERLSSSVVLKTPDEVKAARNQNRFSSSTTEAPKEDYRLLSPTKVKMTRQPGITPRVKQLQSKASCVLLALGKEYHQRPDLPWKSVNPSPKAASDNVTNSQIEDSSQDAFQFFGLDDADAMGYTQTPLKATTISRHQRKRANQWRTWQTMTIPNLVQPLLLLRSANNPGSNISRISCHCGMATSQTQVSCIYWQKVTQVTVMLCSCIGVAEQLVSNGLFPCAPYKPSLAVDVDLLDFICGLNAYQAPNNSAWCHAFMAFHSKRENKVDFSFDSLKRRFGNALFWYSVLDNTVAKYLDNFSKSSYERLRKPTDAHDSAYTISTPESSTSVQNSYAGLQAPHSTSHSSIGPRNSDNAMNTSPDTTPTIITNIIATATQKDATCSDTPVSEETCPWYSPIELLGSTLGVFAGEYQSIGSKASLYLQNRCPCCFGGELRSHDLPDNQHSDSHVSKTPTIIVQIDANFGQKRRHGKQDHPVAHPYTRFLSEDTVNAMEAEVQALRPDKDTRQRQKKRTTNVVEDQMESTGLPTSVLDACESTFKAADDKREKASTKFFSDTALMAILCRHDHVLFITNMKSSGEKQFYALALIDAVFKNLPDIDDISVGVLYDIGCQTHRSLIKWGFLAKYHHRLTFGVSIFHAYGHEWPCQLIYNPRKREGFGLSNGEGCERLWSRLKELIPNLRITGFHKRLYILDDRMQSDYYESLEKLSSWLYRSYTTAGNRLVDAQAVLSKLGISEQSLRNGWREQIVAQTKPLPSQSKNRTQTIIQGTLRLHQELNKLQENIQHLELERQQYITNPSQEESLHGIEEIDIMLSDTRVHLRSVLTSYQNRLAALGVEEKHQLSKLLKNEYLTLRMNIRAKKQRIRERVRRRKMELGEMTRRSVPSVNDRKLTEHSEKMISKREPTIIRLISEYNKGCAKLAELIRKKSHPPGMNVLPPQPIDPKRVFTMDTDDSIWEDVGLEDDTTEIPLWLGDDDFRNGIRAMLERDRAQEELQRLEVEVHHLQSWMSRVINELVAALTQANNNGVESVRSALEIRLRKYKEMFTFWSHHLKRIPGYNDIKMREKIGQSSATRDTISKNLSLQHGFDSDDDSDDTSSVSDLNVIEECGFLDTLEMIAINEDRGDEDQIVFQDSATSMEFAFTSDIVPSSILSNKRRRTEDGYN